MHARSVGWRNTCAQAGRFSDDLVSPEKEGQQILTNMNVPPHWQACTENTNPALRERIVAQCFFNQRGLFAVGLKIYGCFSVPWHLTLSCISVMYFHQSHIEQINKSNRMQLRSLFVKSKSSFLLLFLELLEAMSFSSSSVAVFRYGQSFGNMSSCLRVLRTKEMKGTSNREQATAGQTTQESHDI